MWCSPWAPAGKGGGKPGWKAGGCCIDGASRIKGSRAPVRFAGRSIAAAMEATCRVFVGFSSKIKKKEKKAWFFTKIKEQAGK
jgi:hypothetical protein